MSLIIYPVPFEVLSNTVPFGQWNETWEGVNRDDENSIVSVKEWDWTEGGIDGQDNDNSGALCDSYWGLHLWDAGTRGETFLARAK